MTTTKRQRWGLLVTVAAGLLMITLDNSILYTALPTLTTELGATGSQGLWIINAYPLVMSGLLLGAGTLGDRVGHRRMFLIGLVIFGLASTWAAFSPSAVSLICARAALAVGAAAMMPATLALIRISFSDERERNFAIAVWGSLAVVGAAIGPIAGGLLLEHFWWGSVFLINVPVVLATLIAALLVAPANDPDPSKKWDLVSSLQAMVGLAGAVFLIKELTHLPQDWPAIITSALAAVAGVSLFVRRQRRLADPLLDFSVFRIPAFSAGLLGAVFSMFAIGGAELATTQRFQLVAGFSPLHAGLLVATVAIGSLPTALLGGAFLHRIGLRPLIAGGLAVASGGVVLAIGGVAGDRFGLLVAGLLVTGAGLGATMSVASTAIVGNVPERQAGMASSVEEVSYEFGSLTAVAFLGSLLSLVYSLTVELPSGAPATARQSLPDALAVAGGNVEFVSAARSAFDVGYLATMTILAVALAVGAAVTGWLLRPRRPGTMAGSTRPEHAPIMEHH